MIRKAENIILKKRLRKRTESLKRQNKRIRRQGDENRILKNQAMRAAQELDELKDSLTTGYCPFCEIEHLFVWDFEWGLVSHCPRCGARIMQCQMCEKNSAGCDYDMRTDSCSEM